ncbi:dermonecrotic toxin domain-containing protein [Pseudomonas sp. SDO528_S397]
MTQVTPPYFFDEFLLPLKRNEPSTRERALGLTLKDLDWLHTLYYATDQARQNTALRGHPMRVETFSIQVDGQFTAPLAGSFMMSPCPDDAKALLYSPYGGLEVFADRDTLLEELESRIRDVQKRTVLIHFLSVQARHSVLTGARLDLLTRAVDGAVFEDQEQALEASRQHNLLALLNELRKTPTLDGMLATVLSIMAHPYFPGLDQRDTRVNSYLATGQWVASVPLSQAVLQFYVAQTWPAGQTRTFTHPRHLTTGLTPVQRSQTQERWHSLVEQTCGVFSRLLGSLLTSYWHEDAAHGQPRLDFFAEVMSDTFRLDLLLKRQNGLLSTDESQQLLRLFLTGPAPTPDGLYLEKVRFNAPYQHYVTPAGTFMTCNSHAYLYTALRGLQILENLDDLNATLLAMLKAAGHQDELLNFLSLEERSVFLGLDPVQVSGVPVSGNAFTGAVDDIMAKQSSNLEHALALYRRNDGRIDPGALLDCALDVRSLFDARLHTLDAGGRWSVHPVSNEDGRPSTVKAEQAKRLLPPLRHLQTSLAALRRDQPTFRRLAAHALDQQLQQHKLALLADQIYLNTYPSAAQEREERIPSQTVPMVEHFIQRLADETGPQPDSPRTWFYGPRQQGAAYKINSLSTALFNTIIEAVMHDFARHDVRALPQLFQLTHHQRLHEGLLQGLRGEATLRQLNKTPGAQSLDILHSVLDGDSLTRLTRHGLNGFLPDAFSLSVNTAAHSAPLGLANCFVLTERGGTDPQHSGLAVLWTPGRGHETFASVQHLQEALAQRLNHPLHRLHLLENLPERQRVPHQAWQPGALQRIDDHLLDNRQQSYCDGVLDGIDYRLAMGLGARALQDSLDALLQQPAPNNLARATRLAEAIIHQQALPAWLGMASAEEQRLHAELLEQYRLSAPDENDYLHSLTPLREHVASALAALLKARFTDVAIDPKDVRVATRQPFDGPALSLTDFALRHLPDLTADTLQLRSRTTTPLPDALDAHAVVQLVQQLNLKQVYHTLLDTHLGADTDDARQRRQLFCQQLRWQLLCHAHEECLEERLSAAAWRSIQQVFDMPDGVARAGVSGVTAIIKPLQLVATAGAPGAQALGLYVIGPPAGHSGPRVLYSPYRPERVFQEYLREEDLLQDLGTPGHLQDWVSQHLEKAHQATYRNLWHTRAQPGAKDIHLGAAPITGNVLFRLFNDNLSQLKHMLACQFDALGRAAWSTVTRVLDQGIPKALQFMAGKLAWPLTVWRSYRLFKASAENLQQHRWRDGLKTFVQGVAQLATLRQELDTLLDDTPAPAQLPVSTWLDAPPLAAMTSDTLDITQPRRTRMQAFEDHDIALDGLVKNPVTHTYRDDTTLRSYVPVAGKVYPVKRINDRWYLTRDDRDGPFVQRNAQNEWVLDLSRHHPRYGKTLSRYTGGLSTRFAAREIINVQASGMRDIAALSSWKAQCINEALNVATYYAVNCKRNLALFRALREPGSRAGRFFTELFGVHRLTPQQLARVEKKIDEVLNELVNPTLTRPDSTRFVCGTSRWHPDDTYAFTLPDDAYNTIYLLDRFFDPRMDVYQNRLTAPFDLSAHARASTLIHELTHVVSNTEDIAYVDSMRPFHDLINTAISGASVLRTDLSTLRRTALSTLTPATMLFRTWSEYSDSWHDLGSVQNTRPAKKRILQITGAKTLDQARQTFMTDEDKRIDIILANADSLTYLMTQLGRELDAGA